MITCDCKKKIAQMSQKFSFFFCFLFPVSDHLAWSRVIVRIKLLKCQKSSVFDSADQACWQITAVDLQKEMADTIYDMIMIIHFCK